MAAIRTDQKSQYGSKGTGLQESSRAMEVAVATKRQALTSCSLLSRPWAFAGVATAHIMNGWSGPFEYDKNYGKSRTPMRPLVPLLGVPHSFRRGPPRRGCAEGGKQMKIARRVILSLASVAALALAGGAHWRVG